MTIRFLHEKPKSKITMNDLPRLQLELSNCIIRLNKHLTEIKEDLALFKKEANKLVQELDKRNDQ